MKKIFFIFSLFALVCFSACASGGKDNAAADTSSGGETTMTQKLYITVNGKKVSATLVENSSTLALVEKLKDGSVTYQASDYGDFEKVGDLPWTLPRNDTDITTEAGDLILYLGSRFVIYYDTNTWDFTRLGKVEGMTQAELKEFLNAGGSAVNVTLSLY